MDDLTKREQGFLQDKKKSIYDHHVTKTSTKRSRVLFARHERGNISMWGDVPTSKENDRRDDRNMCDVSKHDASLARASWRVKETRRDL